MALDVLRCFIENPIESLEESERFITEIEDFMRKKAYSLEENLDNSNIVNGQLEVEKFSFVRKDVIDTAPYYVLTSLSIAFNGDLEKLEKSMFLYTKKTYDEFSADSFNDHENIEAEEVKAIQKVWSQGAYKRPIIEFLNTNSGGCYSHDFEEDERKAIKLNHLPESVHEKIDVPKVLQPLVDHCLRADIEFKHSLLHELNHAYLANNCSKYEEVHDEEWFDSFNEIFAFFVGYLVQGEKFENISEDLYSRPDIIEWGLSILITKNDLLERRGKKETGVDFVRHLMMKMAEADNPLGVFLNFCLYDYDKKRITNFQSILMEAFDSIENFENYLDDLEPSEFQGSRDKKKAKIKEIEEIKRSIDIRQSDIPSPDSLRETLLREVLREAVEGKNPSYDNLREINKKITTKLTDIIDVLHSKGEILETERKKFEEDKINEEFGKMEKELSEYIDSMEDLVEEGSWTTQLSNIVENIKLSL